MAVGHCSCRLWLLVCCLAAGRCSVLDNPGTDRDNVTIDEIASWGDEDSDLYRAGVEPVTADPSQVFTFEKGKYQLGDCEDAKRLIYEEKTDLEVANAGLRFAASFQVLINEKIVCVEVDSQTPSFGAPRVLSGGVGHDNIELSPPDVAGPAQFTVRVYGGGLTIE